MTADRDDDALPLPWRPGEHDHALDARLDTLIQQVKALRHDLVGQLETLRLELIEVRQEVAIASNALRLALKEVALVGTVDKKTGAVTLIPTRPH